MKLSPVDPAGARFLALLLILGAACASPDFAPEAPFTRPLKGFLRLEPRVLAPEFAKNAGLPERDLKATSFSKDYREALLLRLHRHKILDKLEGPLLVLEGRLLRYEWTVKPGTSEMPEQVSGTIEVTFRFTDEAGVRIGAGKVTANESGSDARTVMERAEKHVVYSMYKFLRKETGRPVEPEPAEPQVSP
jgi:hypothetical protein